MKKIEYIYREILHQSLEKNNYRFTQLGLAKAFQISLSTVSHALEPLRKMGAIKVNLKNFQVIDAKKILLYWASIRNLSKDIIYQTRVEMPIKSIEASMPNDITYAAYSAVKFRFKQVPSDYSEVYIYGLNLDKRFPLINRNPNLLVLRKDEFIGRYGKTTSIAQTFVDLWNIPTWYANEFVKYLEEKIDGLLE